MPHGLEILNWDLKNYHAIIDRKTTSAVIIPDNYLINSVFHFLKVFLCAVILVLGFLLPPEKAINECP